MVHVYAAKLKMTLWSVPTGIDHVFKRQQGLVQPVFAQQAHAAPKARLVLFAERVAVTPAAALCEKKGRDERKQYKG